MWQSDSGILAEVTSLISDAVLGTNNARQQEIASRISQLSQNPEFSCYLLLILTTDSINLTVRLASGHTLKSILEKKPDIPIGIIQYLQNKILHALADPQISSAICSIASTLYIILEGWPELFSFVAANINLVNSLNVLCVVFEDISTYSALAYLLSRPEYSEVLKTIIIKLLELAQSQNLLAFKAMNQLLKIMPTPLMPLVSKYMDVLISVPVNDYIAEGIFALSCARKDVVKRNFKECAEIMMRYMASEKGAIGCNFWMEFIREKDLLQPYLEQLLFTVLGNLKLTDEDIMQMMPENEDFRFDKEEGEKNWSKRRESAILMDNLGQRFGGICFLILQNAIQNLLLAQDWVSIESGLLGLGALAPGSGDTLLPSLPIFLPFLLQQTQHPEKLVVAMALWTTSRFTDYIISTTAFQTYLDAIMKAMSLRESIVQQAACTSFCILISRGPEDLQPYLDSILQIFSQYLGLYHGKALINLLDAISSVSDVMSEAIQDQKYISLLFEPVIELWNRTSNGERLMWTLCETLSSIILSLGSLVESYFQNLLGRCCQLVEIGLSEAEKQFAIKALELAGVIIENSSQLDLSQLLPLIPPCLDQSDVSLRQYASATIGDIVSKSSPNFENYMENIIPKLYPCLCVLEGPEDISSLFSLACNNAACALGEIAVQYPKVIENKVQIIADKIIECVCKIAAPLAYNAQGNNQDFSKGTHLPQVRANLLCAVGKLGMANSSALGQRITSVLYIWCEAMEFTVDPRDKYWSLKGLLRALACNLGALDNTFQYFAKALVDYKDMPDDLRGETCALLAQVKGFAGEGWEKYVGLLPFRQELQAKFQV
ncbi:hypothetical protein SteCoe_10484 [Stentor coeruleus]|uniref:Importin N-terminal domain-containing protein n=1 Tax=Stentor coeruleus TaxID=5963 RepID=A0A1R2CFE8_9CILI|nr:hypothetical protein SteCoe_10484 [Stentor coeruleus]